MFINQFPPNLLEAAIKILGGFEGSKSLFQTGDVVEGSVVKVISPKEALVRIGGVELFAATEKNQANRKHQAIASGDRVLRNAEASTGTIGLY